MYTKLKVIKRSEALKLCQKNLLPDTFSLRREERFLQTNVYKIKVIKRSEALKLCQKNLLPDSFSLQITFFFSERTCYENYSTSCRPVKMASKTVTRSIHISLCYAHASSVEAEEEMQMTIMLVVIVIHVFIQGINYLKKRLQHRFFHSLATVT